LAAITPKIIDGEAEEVKETPALEKKPEDG